MRQGAEQSAPTSLPCTITCMIMLIIVNRIQFLYYSSLYAFVFNWFSDMAKVRNIPRPDHTQITEYSTHITERPCSDTER